VYMC